MFFLVLKVFICVFSCVKIVFKCLKLFKIVLIGFKPSGSLQCAGQAATGMLTRGKERAEHGTQNPRGPGS